MNKENHESSHFLNYENREFYRYRRQWIISKNNNHFPHWESTELGIDYYLSYHPELRISQCHYDGLTYIIIGIAVYTEQPEQPFDNIIINEKPKNSDDFVGILNKTGGTYAIITLNENGLKIYSDPMGLMGVFFDLKGNVSSTPALLPDIEVNTDLDKKFPLNGSNEWYPGSLTRFKNVKKLYANHYLDIPSFEIKRFWPNKPFPSVLPEEGIDRIINILENMMKGVNRQGDLIASLSGGKDSRSVLAASKDISDKIEYFTFYGSSMSNQDELIVKQLLEIVKIKHRFIELKESPSWLLEMYDEMTGNSFINISRFMSEAIRENFCSKQFIHINGAAGEISLPFYWHNKNPKKVKMSSLLKKQGNKPKIIKDSIKEWLSTIPEFCTSTTIYNLMFAEQIEAKWQSLGETAGNLFYESFTPYSNREIIEIMNGLPTSFVASKTVNYQYVKKMWPELVEVPYTKTGHVLFKYIPRNLKDYAKKILKKSYKNYLSMIES